MGILILAIYVLCTILNFYRLIKERNDFKSVAKNLVTFGCLWFAILNMFDFK